MASIQSVAAAGSLGASAAPAAKGSEIQDRFLKLLVTQMKNQDPLNPLDNAQVTSQLAQINTVNGIEALNTTLQQMSASFLAGQSLQSATLIGRTALADGNGLALAAGAAARGGVQLERAADSVKVTINSAAGNVVRELELGSRNSGLVRFDWDGRNDAGATVVPGAYTFRVTARGAGQDIAAVPVASGTISSVTPGASGTRITVEGIGELTLQQIRGIR